MKQVVRVLAPPGEPLDNGQDQPQVSFNELLAGILIARFAPAEQLHGLIIFQNLQLRCIDPRDLDFSLHQNRPPAS